MKKIPLLLFLLIFSLFASFPLYAEESTNSTTEQVPVIKNDEKKELIFTGSENFKILPESKENLISKIEKKINLFSDRLKEKFSIWLSRSTKYIETMKEILVEKGLPEDLVYLPLIESGFNVNARSPAKAVGPWQFIESTGRRYGLTINWWIDERKDPIKSTIAAAEYLKDLYKMFGDWSLALAAYNAGEGRVGKAVSRIGEYDYWNLLNTRYLPKETKDYVPKYIAAITIAKKPEIFGFENLREHPPLEYDEVIIPSPTDIDIIAQCAQTDVQTIRELNPELKRWSTPMNVRDYKIRIPSGTEDIFFENFNKIPEEKRFSYDTYISQKGDTAYKIAKKLKLTTVVLYEMNGSAIFVNLKPGTKIKIPPKDKFTPLKEDLYEAKKSNKKRKVSSNKREKKNSPVKKVAHKTIKRN